MPEEEHRMTESTPEVVTTEEAAQVEAPAPTAEDIAKLQKALDKERELRKTYEGAAKEAENQRKASMTDAERAVAEAEARGRSSAMSEYGQRLVRSDFVAEAARRNPEYDAAGVLDDLNLARFLTEDGEPDSKAIAKAVERLVPAAGPRFGNADQGPRGGSPVADFNQELRRAAGRA
jgi:predicted secreted protein